jgi:hypothetical protein
VILSIYIKSCQIEHYIKANEFIADVLSRQELDGKKSPTSNPQSSGGTLLRRVRLNNFQICSLMIMSIISLKHVKTMAVYLVCIIFCDLVF